MGPGRINYVILKNEESGRHRWILTACPPRGNHHGRKRPLGPSAVACLVRQGTPRGQRTFPQHRHLLSQKIGLEYLTVARPLFHGELEAPAGGGFRHRGPAEKYLLESIEKMEKDKIKLHFFGDLEPLPQELKDMCRKTSEISEQYEMEVNVCFNYGGRDEIVRAARHFAADCAAGGRKPEELTEVLFSEYLCSNGVADPDLVIRPSGEVRISNFLLAVRLCGILFY